MAKVRITDIEKNNVTYLLEQYDELVRFVGDSKNFVLEKFEPHAKELNTKLQAQIERFKDPKCNTAEEDDIKNIITAVKAMTEHLEKPLPGIRGKVEKFGQKTPISAVGGDTIHEENKKFKLDLNKKIFKVNEAASVLLTLQNPKLGFFKKLGQTLKQTMNDFKRVFGLGKNPPIVKQQQTELEKQKANPRRQEEARVGQDAAEAVKKRPKPGGTSE